MASRLCWDRCFFGNKFDEDASFRGTVAFMQLELVFNLFFDFGKEFPETENGFREMEINTNICRHRFPHTVGNHQDGQNPFTSIPQKYLSQMQDCVKTTASSAWRSIHGCFRSQNENIVSKQIISTIELDDDEPAGMLHNAALDAPIDEMHPQSEILYREDVVRISRHLPSCTIGNSWILLFATSRHGFSLNTLYSSMEDVICPVLIVIEDTLNRVFGALISSALKISKNHYGTAQSFFFTLRPDFNVYNWSGNNFYFILGERDCFSLGCGSGKFGLWLDGNLYKGRTEECETYSSPPLVPERDFLVKSMECWSFSTNI